MLTQERLRELFDYREDGALVRKTSASSNARAGDVVGCLGNHGYLTVQVDGKIYLIHRLNWLWHYGYIPENQIDHIDRIKKHNEIENLREVGNQCNLRNTGNPKNNTSGVKGVCWSKQEGKWLAYIKINRKNIYFGYHSDLTEAIAHRLAAEQAVDWQGCDGSSPAYQFMQGYIK